MSRFLPASVGLRHAARRLPAVRRLLAQRDQLAADAITLREQLDEVQLVVDGFRSQVAALKRGWPPGHYHSPIPSADEIEQHRARRTPPERELGGVNLNEAGQLALLTQLAQYYSGDLFPDQLVEGFRYYFDNDQFSYGDGVMLHCMLRHLRPQRVIEVGSGFSSALVLDTNERFLDSAVHCTFIEPNPGRLRSLLGDHDLERAEIIARPVQDVDQVVFDQLHPNDVLFIDSSHVAKYGSDVNALVFDVLPRLRPGVHVHVHDVFYPFEYPDHWIDQGWAWSEDYLLRAFLQFNSAYRITLFNSFLNTFHRNRVIADFPLWGRNPGGSIWLERTSDGLA